MTTIDWRLALKHWSRVTNVCRTSRANLKKFTNFMKLRSKSKIPHSTVAFFNSTTVHSHRLADNLRMLRMNRVDQLQDQLVSSLTISQ
jgi:hypothetical protein